MTSLDSLVKMHTPPYCSLCGVEQYPVAGVRVASRFSAFHRH